MSNEAPTITPHKAREIAAALIFAEETAEKKQGGNSC